ncbi:MAG TPA: hypothetical protein VEB66_16025 [Opitutaceae bacterium]|nr:hypothetical protein [Opitutaceae bacterium]
MNVPCLARLAAVTALLLSAAPTAFAKETMLVDFAASRKDPDGTTFRPYEYTFQDWGGGKVHDDRGRGALVRAKSGKGGLGENRTMVRFDKTPAVELAYILGNGNRASGLSFALTDKDGTEHQWNVPFNGQVPGREYRHRMTLAQRDQELKPGKIPGLDLKKIVTWQVRGNYQDAPVEVMLRKLVAVD